MLKTSNYKTADGVTHSTPVGIVKNLTICTYPQGSEYASFDFFAYHNLNAMSAGKDHIFATSFRVEGPELLPFISNAQTAVRNGKGIVDAEVEQAESYIMDQTGFTGWKRNG
ncbi:hypothetical protein [Candidatus Venteria ishoeyi]|uniref:Uncharacterized protein n=1 Tax=Candidatus Venteria ishoeyi TaxID=1899563 RepID=A0A1H6FBT1_9GAMM|nr:hypothetical protein [Candidatus Venteria ishoeyi]SEH06504.1 Uncharacterised protein [Candidatus Venteria ishoeyi]